MPTCQIGLEIVGWEPRCKSPVIPHRSLHSLVFFKNLNDVPRHKATVTAEMSTMRLDMGDMQEATLAMVGYDDLKVSWICWPCRR